MESQNQKKVVYGITGSFGTGKSTAAKIIAEKLNARIIDADIVAKTLMNEDPSIRHMVHEAFGDQVFDYQGNVDTRKLASIVFGNSVYLKRLEGIIHPAVIEYVRDNIRRYSQARHLIVEAPLLIESGLHKDMDILIVVLADEEKIYERLKDRGFSAEEVNRRLSNQLPQSEKRIYADIVIENNATVEELKNNINTVFK